MARTKQSANKVTGGKAPRVTLQAFQKKKSKALTASSRPTPRQRPIINNFCVMCRDGGNLLWICDEKYHRRVVCSKCLVIPEGVKDKLEQGDVTFKCVTCHWKWNQANPQPYFHATSAQVASLPTALVHLHMDNLKVGHAQANMMDCYFQPYFDKDNNHFSHLSFNLATEESMRTYERTAIDLTHSLSSFMRVVIFLTHS
ncbi:hypothetical protein F5141DRAFT_1061650 [Pisolithus sp. B1]|nr:hypothetical protein F5141DRAFT_1061650 [Pisolithus sp. B1]